MATSNITNTAKDPSGTAVAGVVVTAPPRKAPVVVVSQLLAELAAERAKGPEGPAGRGAGRGVGRGAPRTAGPPKPWTPKPKVGGGGHIIRWPGPGLPRAPKGGKSDRSAPVVLS